MKFIVKNIINTSNAISHSDGLVLFKFISKNLNNGESIISFEGVNRVSTAFLNASIGKLVMEGIYHDSLVCKETTETLILNKIETVIDNAQNSLLYNDIVTRAAFC